MEYRFTLTAEQTGALWSCIQNAPLPRAMTDELAVAFRQQVEAQNRAREAEAAAKANGRATDQANG